MLPSAKDTMLEIWPEMSILTGFFPGFRIQTSPVHTGLCEDPDETLTRLMERLVA